MKKIAALTVLLSLICLTGCSKTDPNAPVTVKWENGTTSIDGNTVYFSEYSGDTARIENGLGGYTWDLSIDSAKDVTTLTENVQGILEEDMEQYKGKFYYQEYLGTQHTMAALIGEDTWSVCKTFTDRDADATVIMTYASDYIDNIPLTYNLVYADFGDFILGNEYDKVKVRPDCALISGIIKVSMDPHETSEPYTVVQDEKEYQLTKASGSKYDYYTYGVYTIQIVAGMNIQDYITFK